MLTNKHTQMRLKHSVISKQQTETRLHKKKKATQNAGTKCYTQKENMSSIPVMLYPFKIHCQRPGPRVLPFAHYKLQPAVSQY